MAVNAEWKRRECRWRDLHGCRLLKVALDGEGLGSRKRLAERLNTRETYIYAWTIGYRRPPKDDRPILQALFDIPVSAWSTEEEQRKAYEKERVKELALREAM